METGNIKPIDRSSIHKICSGQVVLTLAIAVKELVENGLDAGASTIDVILKNHGIDFVEVSDDGRGVKPSDFQSLTLKHHTSKIADFADVSFVSTFGFRGEALSSLCALSNLEITTRSTESDVGTLLIYDHNGSLVKKTPTHKQVGTTVTLKNLFSTLPVRHKEFLRNSRKEYSKMIHLLTAYCLISLNKRISCYHISDKGKKTTALQTNNDKNYKDNIMAVFGDKQMKQLVEIVKVIPSKEILDEYFLPHSSAETCNMFRIEGYISSCKHGEGRSSSDRQFYFINGRPCDVLKISKLINEIYHSFNKHQYPFVFLNIVLNEGCADVNVTPDKRKVFIPDEKVLFALIKATLLETYGKQSCHILAPLNFLPLPHLKAVSSVIQNNSEIPEPAPKRKFEVSVSDGSEENISSKYKKRDSFEEAFVISPKLKKSDRFKETTPIASPCVPSPLIASPESSLPAKTTDYSERTVSFALTIPTTEDKLFKISSPKKGVDSKHSNDSATACLFLSGTSSKSSINSKADKFLEKLLSRRSMRKKSRRSDANASATEPELQGYDRTITEFKKFDSEISLCGDEAEICKTALDEPSLRTRQYKEIPFDMKVFDKISDSAVNQENNTDKCNYRKFRSKIVPGENRNAEEELKKEINKESFVDMDIIGQFNLGFIISKLHEDLFIIDQHATDEKYNFELLQNNTVLETQQLLQPQTLELTAASETILLEHQIIFEKNGFRMKIEEDGPPGRRVQLVSVPVSQGWSFGKEDIDEIIFMLTDNPVRMVRPSRIRQMFASRACRKSVMIGTALSKAHMKRLVTHMGEIEQPWNCPHGRPTIRHLFNLNLLSHE